MKLKKNFSLFVQAAETLTCAGRVAAVLLTVMLTMTSQTAWADEIKLGEVTSNITLNDGDVLTGTLDGSSQPYKISIAAGATVTLSNVTINGVHNNKYSWAGLTCLGNATIILAAGTTNTVTGFNRSRPGIQAGPTGTTLIIKGTGKLTASSQSGGSGNGPGIGSDLKGTCGNIEIQGGDITAKIGNTLGTSAGIGSSMGGTCGNITISGGKVTATGGRQAAGIGSGSYGHCGDITISSGTVIATGGTQAAGIGSGAGTSMGGSTCGDITISGGTVTASSSTQGTGIGAGPSSNANKKCVCGDITISGGSVTATGKTSGIGTGKQNCECGSITITSDAASVVATRGQSDVSYIGAGGSTGITCGTVTIDGVVNATTESSFTHFASTVSDNIWTLSNTSYLDVTFGSLPEGVTGVATPNKAKSGETVTLSFSGISEGKVPVVSATYGGSQTSLDIIDNGDGTYSFVMGDGPATVTVSELKNDIKLFAASVPNQTKERFGGGEDYDYIVYKFEDANSNPTSNVIGEIVKNGETTLTLGTDYEFGDVYYSDMTGFNQPEDIDDECLVEIKGIGDYGGIIYAPFTIISPSANGTHLGLSWSLAGGTLSITGKGAMAAVVTNDYPWKKYCSLITTINIGEGVTSIADNAFGAAQNNSIYTYNNVAKVTIPASVTSIGADAFKGCISTTDVYCYADPTKLTWGDTGDDFKSDGSTKCHVADASAWSSFESVNVTFEGDLAEKSIPYIDADGNTAYCTDFTVIDGSEDRYYAAGWYVVKGEVSKEDGGIDFLSEAHIILADDATLTLSNGTFEGYSHLTIYGQTKGNGTLNVTKTDGYGIMTNFSGNLTINGGIINATGGRDGLSVAGNLVINGGTVTGTTKNDDYSLYVYGTITINGGQVTANGDILSTGDLTISGGQVTATGSIASNGDVTLGWTSGSDYIKASEIGPNYDTNTVSIANGKAFTDGTSAYTSVTPSATLEALTNVTLRPITGVTLTKDGSDNLTATLDPTSEEEVSIPVAVEVDHVEVNRTYESGKASTVYLPFTIAVANVSGGTFNKFTGVDETTTPMWTVKYTEVTSGNIEANTPYIFLPDGGKITVNNTTPITVGTEIASAPQTASGWEFIGTHKRIKWTHDTTDPEYTSEREAEIGTIYGFAANDSGTDHVGDFVKVGNNVWINPERAYLKRSTSSARAMTAGNETQQLPEKMKVVIVKANGETTEIGTLSIDNGQWIMDNYYGLDGRRLSGKPTKSGLYIKNGKKVLVP